MPNSKKILFVCTGNTCRSPMAEAISEYLADKKNLETIDSYSRGISVLFPAAAEENAIIAVKENLDIDTLQNHKATQISKEDIEKADLVITMTDQHKLYIEDIYEGELDHVYSLYELAGEEGELADPFGGDIFLYKETANEILRTLKIIFDKIEKGEIL